MAEGHILFVSVAPHMCPGWLARYSFTLSAGVQLKALCPLGGMANATPSCFALRMPNRNSELGLLRDGGAYL
jgi:hypothetical protein